MTDHILDIEDAKQYLGQFDWVKDFTEVVIEQLLNPKEPQHETL